MASQALLGPPPSPVNPGPTPGGGVGTQSPQQSMSGGMPGGPPDAEQDPAKVVMAMGAEVDRVLTALAQAYPQAAEQFRISKQSLQQALAKIISEGGEQSPSLSPTYSGSQFPGSMGSGY